MSTKNRSNEVFHLLRRKAEQLVYRKGYQPPESEDLDLMRLVHELEVQYAELELQNEELRRGARELEASRDAFAELFHNAPVGFIVLNQKGIIEQVNQVAAQMLCSGGDDFATGQSFINLVHPEDRDQCWTQLRKWERQPLQTPFDLRIKGGKDCPSHVQVHVHCAGNQKSGGLHWRLALVDVTARWRFEELMDRDRRELEERVAARTTDLERRTRQLARLTGELTLAEQRERRRLAELLHDHLQQILAGARLNLEILAHQRGLEQEPEYQSILDMIVAANQAARSLSSELSPPVLYLHGLSSALKWLARWMKQNQKLEVEVQIDPAGDPQREDHKVLLYQSVRELLFNAAKYADTGLARVEMAYADGCTQIIVSDRGAGFDTEAFDREGQALDGGFGLFSIRERLELLGGRFEISSAPGRGTTATLTLPLLILTDAKPPAFRQRRTRGIVEAAGGEEGGTGGKIRVLLVDDHAMMRKGLAMLLAGHEDIVVAGEAENGRYAVELARRIHPDVVLMDINMPEMNGLDATRCIHSELPATRIIALTMHEADDQAQAMYEAGATGYLNKNISPATLLNAIRNDTGPWVT